MKINKLLHTFTLFCYTHMLTSNIMFYHLQYNVYIYLYEELYGISWLVTHPDGHGFDPPSVNVRQYTEAC